MSHTADSQVDPRLPAIRHCLYRIAVKAIIIRDGRLLLVQEQDDEWWSIPGGGVDYGETVDQALRRELSEELGVDPEAVQIDDTVQFVAIGAIVKGIPKANLFYRVQVPTETIQPTAHVTEHKWCTADEISKLYMSPSTGNVIEQIAQALQ